MSGNEILAALSKPFPSTEIEWKIQVTTKDKAKGMVVPYIDCRAIQNRLDEVFGLFNWQNIYTTWHDKSQICGISVFCEERREWVTKYDGAANSDIEPIKGGISDAFKRAAVLFGIGRYIYNMDSVWVELDDRGKIKKDQYAKLTSIYESAVSKLTNGARPDPAPKPKTPPKPASKTKDPAEQPSVPNVQAPANPPIGAEDKVVQFPMQGSDLYTVQSVKKQPGANGVNLALEMTGPDGKTVKAFFRGENEAITAGVQLKDVKLTQKTSGYGPYMIVETCEIAA